MMLIYTQLIPCGKVKSWVSSPECYLSEDTVRNYLFRILDKLGMSSRVELLLYAFSAWRESPCQRLLAWLLSRKCRAGVDALLACARTKQRAAEISPCAR
jgi:hypothetical protein